MAGCGGGGDSGSGTSTPTTNAYAGTYSGNLTDWTVSGVTHNDSGTSASIVVVIDATGNAAITQTSTDASKKTAVAVVSSQGTVSFTYPTGNFIANCSIVNGVITGSYSVTNSFGQAETGHVRLTKV